MELKDLRLSISEVSRNRKRLHSEKNQDSRVAANVTAEDLIIKLRGLNETIFGSELDRLD